METLNLPLTIKIFKEGSSKSSPYVAYNSEFDISSCGSTEQKAQNMLKEAIKVLLFGAKEDGTLLELLEEAGFVKNKKLEHFPKIYLSMFSFPIKISEIKYA